MNTPKSLEREFLDLPFEEVDKILHSISMDSFNLLVDEIPLCSNENCEILNEIENNG